MRVITGKAKGMKLKMPKGGYTRPVMDRVKEATFNIIAHETPGGRFLDLFAGAGNLGIEALSRGAASAVFVDLARECTQTIKENLRHTKLEENAEVYGMDCLKFLKQFKFNEPFDVVFIDPPYLKGFLEPILEYLPESSNFTENTLFIIERQKKDDLSLESRPEYILTDERKFGDTILTFFKLKKV